MWVEILVACPWAFACYTILVLVFLERPLTTALVLWFFNNRLINLSSSNQVFFIAMANLWGLFKNTSLTNKPLSLVQQQFQQWRGIKVKVEKGNLEKALVVMQRKMQSSGIERLIKRQQTTHLKNSEKRILARKTLERRLRSQDLARKLKSILIKKVRGL